MVGHRVIGDYWGLLGAVGRKEYEAVVHCGGTVGVGMWICIRNEASVLGCIAKGVTSREREVIVPIDSAPLRPHVQRCIQAWGPQLFALNELMLLLLWGVISRMGKRSVGVHMRL